MEVNITYHDNSSFTMEEAVKLAQHNYGRDVKVRVVADSPAPHDLIYFALQQIITHKQLSMLFDDKFMYQRDIKELRADTLNKLTEILDSVIIDNESKVA
jgi:hypothetical protein